MIRSVPAFTTFWRLFPLSSSSLEILRRLIMAKTNKEKIAQPKNALSTNSVSLFVL